MISSVPYVPPETIKNVAATKGQSVSLATFFFAGEIARAGNWAGKDNVLNFYSRSSLSERSVTFPRAASQSQNTRLATACKKKMHPHTKCLRSHENCREPERLLLRECCMGLVLNSAACASAPWPWEAPNEIGKADCCARRVDAGVGFSPGRARTETTDAAASHHHRRPVPNS